jgi:hypothetical protein
MITKQVPKKFSGETYLELKDYVESDSSEFQVIGIMENTGNPYRLKEKAIRDAQKTANVRQLVNNLTSVRDIRVNQPIFSPKNDHKIDEFTYMIVIESEVRWRGRGRKSA